MINDWGGLISNVGLPIGICLYFIFKVERVIKNNTIAVTKLIEIAKKCEVKHARK